MISFPKLGNYGRLGNQLFQYAFVRSSAVRLNTMFHVPAWDGDRYFQLDEQGRREMLPAQHRHHLVQGPDAGFSERYLELADDTNIEGFFQSDRYYSDKAAVRRWFTFSDAIRETCQRWQHWGLLASAASISLRLDSDYANTREFFPLYGPSYYERALQKLAHNGPVLVFADRPDLARGFLTGLTAFDFVYVEGVDAISQLFLMSQCGAGNVITNSTFAWWGAWLNQQPGARVVSPLEWCRLGVPHPITGINSNEWTELRATVPVWDHFQVWRLRHPKETLQRVIRRLSHAS
jgi:hypothetical protein